MNRQAMIDKGLVDGYDWDFSPRFRSQKELLKHYHQDRVPTIDISKLEKKEGTKAKITVDKMHKEYPQWIERFRPSSPDSDPLAIPPQCLTERQIEKATIEFDETQPVTSRKQLVRKRKAEMKRLALYNEKKYDDKPIFVPMTIPKFRIQPNEEKIINKPIPLSPKYDAEIKKHSEDTSFTNLNSPKPVQLEKPKPLIVEEKKVPKKQMETTQSEHRFYKNTKFSRRQRPVQNVSSEQLYSSLTPSNLFPIELLSGATVHSEPAHYSMSKSDRLRSRRKKRAQSAQVKGLQLDPQKLAELKVSRAQQRSARSARKSNRKSARDSPRHLTARPVTSKPYPSMKAIVMANKNDKKGFSVRTKAFYS
ncbi:hypothetical protein PCE1_002269 [Barthelona sp. PCE]